MIFKRPFLTLVNDLKNSIDSGQIEQAKQIDNEIWSIVQSTSARPMDALELLGGVGATIRDAGRSIAYSYLKREVFKLALRWYEQLCQFAGEVEPWAEATAWDYYKYAECLAAVGRFDEAILWLEKANDVRGRSGSSNSNLARKIRNLAKKINTARASHQEALEINPDYAEDHYNSGVTFANNGQIEKAISEYREAVRIEPDYVDAHINLGAALASSGLFDEAIGEFREALRFDPNDAAAHNNLGHVLRANGLLDEAIGEFREAVRITPDYAEAHYNLGLALDDTGASREAIESYQNFINSASSRHAQYIEWANQRIRELQ